jgi:flagellar biosynthesis chaperone FliJ
LKLIINGKHEEASMKQQHHPHTPTPTPSRQVNTFSDYLLDELARNNLNLNMYYVNLIRSKLVEYEQFNMRRFEEKDQFIGQLKQNLMELTEKRYRALNKNGENGTSVDQPIDSNALNTNLKFVLNEKDNQISSLLKQLNDCEKEIGKLKDTIKDQDDVILSHNNNIYVS